MVNPIKEIKINNELGKQCPVIFKQMVFPQKMHIVNKHMGFINTSLKIFHQNTTYFWECLIWQKQNNKMYPALFYQATFSAPPDKIKLQKMGQDHKVVYKYVIWKYWLIGIHIRCSVPIGHLRSVRLNSNLVISVTSNHSTKFNKSCQ